MCSTQPVLYPFLYSSLFLVTMFCIPNEMINLKKATLEMWKIIADIWKSGFKPMFKTVHFKEASLLYDEDDVEYSLWHCRLNPFFFFICIEIVFVFFFIIIFHLKLYFFTAVIYCIHPNIYGLAAIIWSKSVLNAKMWRWAITFKKYDHFVPLAKHMLELKQHHPKDVFTPILHNAFKNVLILLFFVLRPLFLCPWFL